MLVTLDFKKKVRLKIKKIKINWKNKKIRIKKIKLRSQKTIKKLVLEEV